jgi:hypothetical protein
MKREEAEAAGTVETADESEGAGVS